MALRPRFNEDWEKDMLIDILRKARGKRVTCLHRVCPNCLASECDMKIKKEDRAKHERGCKACAPAGSL